MSPTIRLGDTVKVHTAGPGYRTYINRPGIVTRTFDVPGHGLKLVITYPGTNLWAYETFATLVTKEDA